MIGIHECLATGLSDESHHQLHVTMIEPHAQLIMVDVHELDLLPVVLLPKFPLGDLFSGSRKT